MRLCPFGAILRPIRIVHCALPPGPDQPIRGCRNRPLLCTAGAAPQWKRQDRHQLARAKCDAIHKSESMLNPQMSIEPVEPSIPEVNHVGSPLNAMSFSLVFEQLDLCP